MKETLESDAGAVKRLGDSDEVVRQLATSALIARVLSVRDTTEQTYDDRAGWLSS